MGFKPRKYARSLFPPLVDCLVGAFPDRKLMETLIGIACRFPNIVGLTEVRRHALESLFFQSQSVQHLKERAEIYKRFRSTDEADVASLVLWAVANHELKNEKNCDC